MNNDELIRKYEFDLNRARKRLEEAQLQVAQLEHVIASVKSMPLPLGKGGKS